MVGRRRPHAMMEVFNHSFRPAFAGFAPCGTCCLRCLLLSMLAGSASGLEHVTLRSDGREHSIVGQVLVTAADGGILLLAADGTLWAVEPQDLVKRTSDDKPLEPLSPEALGRQLLAELPAGFEVYTTHHYLICYNTSRDYAAWCGALFERLLQGLLRTTGPARGSSSRSRRFRWWPWCSIRGRPTPTMPRANWATRPRRSSVTTACVRTASRCAI